MAGAVCVVSILENILGREGRYVFVNKVAAAHARRTQYELQGRTMRETSQGPESEELFSAVRDCLSLRKPKTMENKVVFPDGTIK